MATAKRQQVTSETVTLKLEQQIDRAADAATGALGRLERQIQREENALGRLETTLVASKAKLDAIASGAPSERAVAAFEKQKATVAALNVQLDKSRADLLAMGKAGAEPKAIKSAESAAKKLEAQLAAAKTKLDTLSGPAKGGVVDIAAYAKQKAAVEALTDKIGAQRDKIDALREKQTTASGAAKQLTDASGYLAQRMGVADNQAVKLGQDLLALGPYGAVAAGAILLTVGAITAFVSVIAKGINAAGQMRSELLKLQTSSVASAGGMHWLFNATRESWMQADKLQQMINRVNATSSLGRAKLADYAAQINAARFQGKQAETVLKAMSIAGSAGSESMAGEVLNWAKAMRFTGGSVDGLAERIERKLGKAALAQAISLDVQLRRLGENITWIFGGADIDPFLRALNSVLGLFNAGTSSAQNMRDMVTKLVEWSIGGMLRLGIAVLQAYIALRKNETAWSAVKFAAKAVAFAFVTVAAATTALVAAIVGINAAAMAAGAAIVYGIYNALKFVGTAIVEFVPKVIGFGVAIVDGLANGILSVGGRVWEALKNVVGGAVNSAKAFLGIASPSKLFFGFGANVDQGMAGGIERNEDVAVGAAYRMAQNVADASGEQVANDQRAPMSGTVKVAAPSAESASGSKSVTFTNCTFGQVTEGQIRQWVLAAMEGDALASGRAA